MRFSFLKAARHMGTWLDFVALLSLAGFRVAETVWTWRAGFRTISDDDYSRAQIALAFASSPRLDPSGTSWLPVPFWVQGGWFALVGGGWARVAGFTLFGGIAASVFAYVAARLSGSSRLGSWLGVVLWLTTLDSWVFGSAPVPELWTAALSAGALLVLLRRKAKARWLGGVALLIATWSRYETWPIALWFAAAHLLTWKDKNRPTTMGPALVALLGPALVALLGPALWLLWNAYSHGDALYFNHRVTSFWLALHRDHGAGLRANLLTYPRALFREGWLGWLLLGAHGLVEVIRSRREVPKTPPWEINWLWSLGGVVTLLGGLLVGQLQGGAPTHHPQRALLAASLVIWVLGAEMTVRTLEARKTWLLAVASAAVLSATTLGALAVDRKALALGTDRREEERIGNWLGSHAKGRQVLLKPRDYGYFAILVTSGAHARVQLSGSPDPRKASAPDLLADTKMLSRFVTSHGTVFVVVPSETHLPGGCTGRLRFRSAHWTVLELDDRSCSNSGGGLGDPTR